MKILLLVLCFSFSLHSFTVSAETPPPAQEQVIPGQEKDPDAKDEKPALIDKKNATLGILLSILVPGGGQIYAGNWLEHGWQFLLMEGTSAGLIAWGFTMTENVSTINIQLEKISSLGKTLIFSGFISLGLVKAWSAYNAYKTIKIHNKKADELYSIVPLVGPSWGGLAFHMPF